MTSIPREPPLVVGSRNRHKVQEIADLLGPLGIVVTSIADFDGVAEVEETGTTFAENAAKKASETAISIGQWVLAEDSGLSVDALQGKPGVYSARFSGPQATDDSNNAKLMAEMEGVSAARRGAQYVCHVALAEPTGEICLSVEATCRGRLTESPQGRNGFGYDPYFLLPEYHRTFGELSPIVKQTLSHRARAFQRLIPRLIRLFG
ncbi:MAG: RdgB/HAM1 family non-canonical purine NTP pyrophosphatase [Planctomycetaceae bacterium]